MKVCYYPEIDLPGDARPVATLGNFDGVHLGHQRAMELLIERARELNAPAVAVTFEPHPVSVLRPEQAPKRILTPALKQEVLGGLGLDLLVVIHFTKEFSRIEPEEFVRQVLVPVLTPGDVVLLDNLNVHHASCIKEAVSAAQGQVIFLPSYSPDFSPIEPCWSKVKTFLRGAAARTRRRLEAALRTALQSLRPEDIRGWFTHCGYLVPSE